jgi:Txe/YoeB family toxin of Txe-Axe toxin-antitoxin module
VRLLFTPRGWEDYNHWQTADRQKLKRVMNVKWSYDGSTGLTAR